MSVHTCCSDALEDLDTAPNYYMTWRKFDLNDVQESVDHHTGKQVALPEQAMVFNNQMMETSIESATSGRAAPNALTMMSANNTTTVSQVSTASSCLPTPAFGRQPLNQERVQVPLLYRTHVC